MTKIRLNNQTANMTLPVMYVDSTGPWNGAAHVDASTISDADLATAVNAETLNAVVSANSTLLYYEATIPSGVSLGCAAYVFSNTFSAGNAWNWEVSPDEAAEQSVVRSAFEVV